MAEKTYKAVQYGHDPYNQRYCIIDAVTGEILDDAQGCGYKTPQKAYAAWAYKNRGREEREAKDREQRGVWAWLKTNPEFESDLAGMELICAKEGQPLTENTVDELLQAKSLESPWPGKVILRIWRAGKPKPRKRKKK